MKSRLAAVPAEEFRSAGGKAAKLLLDSPLWLRFDALFLFLSMKDEIDTGPLLEAAFRAKKEILVPRVEGKDLLFCRLSSPAGPWRKGPFGVREPAFPAAFTLQASLPPAALVLVPGLAFDREGRRLGRGGGYYDRFLAGPGRAGRGFAGGEGRGICAVGFCMECQLAGSVPAGEGDERVDGLLTEKGLLVFGDFCYTVDHGTNQERA